MSRSSRATGSSSATPPARPAAGEAFPRSARLLKHSDFDHVYRNGRRHFSENLTAFFLARPQPGGTEQPAGARVGLTVGRALGGAVERNRIKRRMREAVRLRRQELPAAVDIVINPRKSVLQIEFQNLVEEVGRAFTAVRRQAATGARR